MKKKTIKSVLVKKIDEWLGTIENEQLRNEVAANVIVTGGSITSMLMNEQPKDFDFYFRNKETVLKVARYYVNQWNDEHPDQKNRLGYKREVYVLDGMDVDQWKRGEKRLTSFCPDYEHDFYFSETDDEGFVRVSHMVSNTAPDRVKIMFPSDGVAGEPDIVENLTEADEVPQEAIDKQDEEKDKKKYRPVFLTTNAITLSHKVQLIIRFYGEPAQIHETYDFEHCCCYYDHRTGEVVTPEKALLCIMNKELFYRGSKYPVCSLFRTRKFIERGWKINAGQFVKMAFQISELDLSDVDVLEDQLVGVDTLYFMQVVSALREQQAKNPGWSFDSTYVASVLDKIF